LLSVLLGPGLIINGIFKYHWERPRPRDIVEFGGPMPYVIAPMRGQGGSSFPCGHCSVGFLYGLGWWIWRGRRPYWARASLAAGLLAGAALGLGRMAAGGHFLSDVVWSALLALGLAHALYYYVLRIPFREAHEANVAAQLAAEIPLSSFAPPPRVLDVRAKAANVEIIVIDTLATRLSISGELHGFGLPTSRLLSRVQRGGQLHLDLQTGKGHVQAPRR